MKKDVSNLISVLLKIVPEDWLRLTTHRLDIYNEPLAKTEFLEQLEALIESDSINSQSLAELPTAYDYIRLGHPLSCVLEWFVAKQLGVASERVVSFASQVMPAMAVMRIAHLRQQKVHIYHDCELPKAWDLSILAEVHGYRFDHYFIDSLEQVQKHGSELVIYISKNPLSDPSSLPSSAHLSLNLQDGLGSIAIVQDSAETSDFSPSQLVAEIQHVRRRESIAMTPASTLRVLENMVFEKVENTVALSPKELAQIEDCVRDCSGSSVTPLYANCGLSMQYAITLGLIQAITKTQPQQKMHLMVPANCYGGTNDQARRLAKCFQNVDFVDLHVDGGADLVSSLKGALNQSAIEDAVPLIIAEIPTNPRVEVPDLPELRKTLTEVRKNPSGNDVPTSIFILDQTFCPNIPFLADDAELSSVPVIAYVSGSKFPSGGLCTAGYCVGNSRAEAYMQPIRQQLQLCDNEATAQQIRVLAEQMPSMKVRIQSAFEKTDQFVKQIQETLPQAKLNFIDRQLIARGFTPSVFSLDLPAPQASGENSESLKRELNKRLIQHMIRENPDDCKNCVSYGQLKSSYWTIPATSTQGTTQEGHKDYIVRISLSPNVDVEKLSRSFVSFCQAEGLASPQ